MNGLTYVGPVKVDWHSEPTYTWESKLDPAGTRDVKIAGEFEPQTAAQLSELAANADEGKTIGGHYGVPLAIWTTNAEDLAQFNGWYLLEGFSLNEDVTQSKTGLPIGTLTLCYLGDGVEVPIARAAAPRGNDFALVAKSIVVSPLRPEDDAGDEFIVDPGGTFTTREYDPSYPWDSARPTPEDGTARIGLYVGTITDATDELDTVCFPRFHLGKGAPRWLTEQGGNVRAVDRRTSPARQVYGPHPFLESTDILLTNGLVSFWVGNRGLVPFLNVQAVVDGSRREVGCVELGTAGVSQPALRRARMTYLTRELGVMALTIDGYGDALVSLRRGEAMLRLLLPSGTRAIWKGAPPVTWWESASTGAGRFGLGLAGGESEYEADQPNFRLAWPPSVEKTTLGKAFWWTPDWASDEIDSAGLWTVFDERRQIMAQLWFDSPASTFKWKVGEQVLESSAIGFEAGEDILVGVTFSASAGMALFLREPGGLVHTVTDEGATTVPDGTPTETAYWVNFSAWGVEPDTWGPDDDVWGGLTHYPEGVIDNDMIFDGPFSVAEFEDLAGAETPLGGLPQPEARMVWYAPFDVDPVIMLMSETDGLVEEAEPDELGRTRAVAYLDSDHREAAALLARDATFDTPAAQHQQLAADSYQELLVRG